MTCPVCGENTQIINSRGDVDRVRRRRKCRDCGHRFTTIELEADLHRRLSKKKEAKG